MSHAVIIGIAAEAIATVVALACLAYKTQHAVSRRQRRAMNRAWGSVWIAASAVILDLSILVWLYDHTWDASGSTRHLLGQICLVGIATLVLGIFWAYRAFKDADQALDAFYRPREQRQRREEIERKSLPGGGPQHWEPIIAWMEPRKR